MVRSPAFSRSGQDNPRYRALVQYRAYRVCRPLLNIDCAGDIILPVYIATVSSDKNADALKKICLTKNANFITNAFSIKEGIRMFEDKKSKAILRSS
jgi:hypothetical protein